jgi:Spy/CpxP family protein refolding chaperone
MKRWLALTWILLLAACSAPVGHQANPNEQMNTGHVDSGGGGGGGSM